MPTSNFAEREREREIDKFWPMKIFVSGLSKTTATEASKTRLNQFSANWSKIKVLYGQSYAQLEQ